MDPYKILGVNRDATQEEILAAYSRKIAKYSPESLDDDDQWIVQQINEALAALSDKKNTAPVPPALPARPAAGGVSSPTQRVQDAEIRESAIAIDSDDSKRAEPGRRRSRSRRHKPNSVLPTIIGTIGGAICAAIVGWYVLGLLSQSQDGDSQSSQAFGTQGDTDELEKSSENRKPLFTRPNPKKADSSNSNLFKPKENADHIGSAIHKDSDKRASDKPAPNNPLSNRAPPRLGGIQPGANPPNMEANGNDGRGDPLKGFPNRPFAAVPPSEFWKTIKKYSDTYTTIDQETITVKRQEQLADWLAEFQSEVNKKPAEVEYAVRDISKINGAIYDVRFTAILGTGMNLANIQFPRIQRLRTNNADRKNVQRGSTVKFKGKIAMTIPAAGVPLHNQPPYMAIFRLTLRGRHDPVTIDFAIQNPKKQFLLPK